MEQPETSKQKPVGAEWIDSFATKLEVDTELLCGMNPNDYAGLNYEALFRIALERARDVMPDRKTDINHVTFQIYSNVQLGNGKSVVNLKVSAFQRF